MTGAARETAGKQITTAEALQHVGHIGDSARRGRSLAVVYIAWGSMFVAMRVAVRSLPPLTMSGVRFLAAGLLLHCWCLWQRRRRPDAGWRAPTRREWRASAILGIALPAAGTGGAAWAEQKIPAGTAALLLATVPVWMIITSRIAGAERISVPTAGGLVLGLAGVAVLINPLAGASPDLLPSAVALGGALFWGCGSVYAKRAPHPGEPLLASGMETICAGVTLCLIGAAGGELSRISAASLVSTSGLALGYLIIFGSLLGYSTYEWLLHHASSQLAGTYAFISPLVACCTPGNQGPSRSAHAGGVSGHAAGRPGCADGQAAERHTARAVAC